MKLGTIIPYLKKFQELYESRETPLEFCWHQHFFPEIGQFCYIKKHRYRFHLDIYFLTLLTFLESLRMVLINMVKFLMMPAKMATPGLLNINIFWKKAYDVIIFVHDVTNTISSRHSNIMYIWSCDPSLVTLAFLWEKLSYTQFYKDLSRKITFLRGGLASSSIITDSH